MDGKFVQTVRGQVAVTALGLILPHEHLFTDLRGPLTRDYAVGDPVAVEHVLKPYLEAAANCGVTALVECSTAGVGRNVAVLRHLAETTPIHIIAPTGVYKEGFIPPDMLTMSSDELADQWSRDITDGIDGTSVRAGFIKIAMSDEGPTEAEVRHLHAAAKTSRRTGAVIASHTIGGAVARREMDILESVEHDPSRFIWVHAQTEPQTAVHIAAAQRGIWLEFDAVGISAQHDNILQTVVSLIDAGWADHLLLSHDAGWYDPAQADGLPKPQGFRGYTALVEEFIPALKARGIPDHVIDQITVMNPARAFAITAAGES